MRCARCLRDTPSVQQREDVCPAYLCDVCYEYERTWHEFKMELGNKDSARFSCLYDRLGELRGIIDGFLREARLDSEKKAGPRVGKETWAGWSDS
jgi:hypothetical protein